MESITFDEWLSVSGLHDFEQIFMDHNMSTLISISVDNNDFVSLLSDDRVSNQCELLQKIVNAIKSFEMQQLIKNNQKKSQIIIDEYKILRRLRVKLDQQIIDQSLKFENNFQIITELKQKFNQKTNEHKSNSILLKQLVEQQIAFRKREKILKDRLRQIHNCNDKECVPVCKLLEIHKNKKEGKIKMMRLLDRELEIESIEIAQIIIEYLVCGYIKLQERMCNIFVCIPDGIVFICIQYYNFEKYNRFNDKKWRKRDVFVHYQHVFYNTNNLETLLLLPIMHITANKAINTKLTYAYIECYFSDALSDKYKYVYGVFDYKEIFNLYVSYFENKCIKKWLIDRKLVHLQQIFIDCKLNEVFELIKEGNHKSKLIHQQREIIETLCQELDGTNYDTCAEIVRKLSDKLSEKEYACKKQEYFMKYAMEQQKEYQKKNKMLVKKLKSIKKKANLKINVSAESKNTVKVKEATYPKPEEIVKYLVFGYLKFQQKLYNLRIPTGIAQICAGYYYNYVLKGWITKKQTTFAHGWGEKRWVIVSGYNIFYGRHKTDIKDPKNEAERNKFLNAIPLLVVQYINFKSRKFAARDENRRGTKFEIGVALDPRTGVTRPYQWKTESRKECDDWVHGLNACKKLLALYLNYLSQKSSV